MSIRMSAPACSRSACLYLEVDGVDDGVRCLLEAGEGLCNVFPEDLLVSPDHGGGARNQPN